MRAVEIKKSEIESSTMPRTTVYGGLNGTGVECINGYPTWFEGRTGGVTPCGVECGVEPRIGTGLFTQPIYGGDIVITGVSGRFPQSENVEEFSRNLFCGTEIYGDNVYGLPNRLEKLRLVDNFDYKFFGINEREVEVMNQRLKSLLKVTYEAIFDSGFSPIELKGSKTGVFIGSTEMMPTCTPVTGYSSLPTGIYGGITGSMETTKLAGLVSRYFQLNGPSVWFDTKTSNSLVALEQAISAIKRGMCEQAIVGGIHFDMLNENQFCEKYGIPEGIKVSCYNGGESVSVVFLQKRNISRRFYAKVLHSMFMEPTTKYESGFTNGEIVNVLRQVYSENKVNPCDVTYVETHGLNCEIEPITEFFGKSRKLPLFIGSTKPCIGHSDPVTGIFGLVKMIVAIQKGMVPTREVKLYNTDGTLKVVELNTRLDGGLMALNSIGLKGLVHIVLQPHCEWMMNKYEPTSFWNRESTKVGRIPRLFTFNGRTEDEITNIFEHVHRCPTDLATHALLNTHSINSTPYTHPYRGFTILNGSRPIREIIRNTNEKRPIWYVFSGMGTNWTGMGKELMQIECFRNSIYKSATILKPYNIDLVHLILKEENERFLYQSVMIPAIQIALVECLKTLGVEPEGIVGHSFGEIVAAYVDGCLTHDETILTSYYRGKFIEEANLPTGGMAIVSLPWEELQRTCPSTIVPAFFNSSESVVLSGPKRSIVQFVEELKLRGIFAKEIESSGIALHSYILTPIIPQFKQTIEKIIRSRKLRSQRWISTSVPEYKWETEECKYITPEYFVNSLVSPVYFEQAIKRIPRNAITIEIGPRSVLKKVLVKSLGEKMRLIDLMRRESPSHVEYFWNSLGQLYNEGINFDLLKLIVPVESIYPVPITTKFLSPLVNTTCTTPSTYGRYGPYGPYGSYYGGKPFDFSKVGVPEVYPYGSEYTYPINYRYPSEYYNTTTPFTSSVLPTPIRNYVTPVVPTTVLPTEYTTEINTPRIKQFFYEIDLTNGSEYEYLTGHKINGQITYPVSGYLYLIWKSLAQSRNIELEQLPVSFENVVVHRPTMINGKLVKFNVIIEPVSGKFEIFENEVVVSSGRVFVPEERTLEVPEFNFSNWSTLRGELFEKPEIYKEFKLRGLEYNNLFQGIMKSNVTGTRGELMWGGKWIPFLESMFQMHTFGKYGLQLPTQIKSLRIDPRIHLKNVIRQGLNSNNVFVPCEEVYNTKFVDTKLWSGLMPVIYDPMTRKCISGGVEINGLYSTSLPKTYFNEPVVLERVNFVPYFEKRGYDEEYYVPEVEYRPQYEYVDTYLNECKHYLTTILRKLEYPTTGYTGLYPTIPTSSSFVKPEWFTSEKYTSGKFLRLLKELATIEYDSQYINKLRTIFSDKFQLFDAWHNDTIFNQINRDVYLKSCLDTIIENIPFEYTTQVPKLKILEISPIMNVVAPKISTFLSTCPNVNVDYHYVPVGELSDEIFCELKSRSTFPINKVEWNIRSQEYPTIPTLKDFDLIIFNGSLGSLPFFEDKILMKQWLNNINERMLKREGFFMVNEFVNHFETINSLKRLEHAIFKPTSEIFSHKFMSECEWRKLFEEGCGFHPVSLKSDSILSTLFLYRRPKYTIVPREYETMRYRDHEIYINEVDSFNWIEKVRQALNESTYQRIWLICENAPTSGIIGLVNTLRRETRGDRIRCVFVADTIGKPWTSYFDMIKKADLVMNVYKNGKWGAYRCLRDVSDIEMPYFNENIKHSHLNILNRGDLSTLSWVQSPEPYIRGTNDMIVNVCYAGLNYRDVLLASGKMLPEVLPKYNTVYGNVFGMEFSGYGKDKRYMGLTSRHGLSTRLVADLRHCWEVPREWTLEQAATVPYSYASAYYALVVKGGLKRGETVLIHSGATPFGQAAISIALQYGCKVFVTVGTPEKREFLMSLFPGRLTEESFGSTKDLLFEKHIMRVTQGRGVDVVLNTLVGEFLQASIRCLTSCGRFLDITSNDCLVPTYGSPLYYKNITVHNVNFESLFEPESYEWKRVYELVEEGIRSGIVRPIRSTIFDRMRVQEAFKHMINMKPFHKILVKVWEPKETTYAGLTGLTTPNTYPLGVPVTVPVVPKMWFSPYYTYVITSGLTPFGLELAQFLVKRGVRKVLLVSPFGVNTPYQAKKLQYLQDEYGAIISVSNYNVRNESECISLLKEAIELSEEKKVGGIFHLENAIEEGIFDIHTPEKFKHILEKKYLSTYFLDKYTRNTDGYFVVFSSIYQGLPHGYATSAVERLCELRRQDGKHALVFNWGPFGELKGLFDRENEFIVSGGVSEKVNKYLTTLEKILLKGDSNTIWSCYVPTPVVPTPVISSTILPAVGYNGIYNTIEAPLRSTRFYETPLRRNCNFYGYPTVYEYIQSLVQPEFFRPSYKLVDMGLEASTIYEIKSFLEKFYNYPVRDVQELTLEAIQKIEQTFSLLKESREINEWKNVVPKYNYLMPRRALEKLNTIELTSSAPVVIIHPIEGHVNMLKTWAKYMKYPVYGMQFTSEALGCDSVESLAEYYWQQLENEFKTVTKFHLAGYSFGSSVAFEMALKKSGRIASLTFLDGSYSYVNSFLNPCKYKFDLKNLSETEAECLYTFISQYTQIPNRKYFVQTLMQLNGLEERIKYAAKELYTTSQFTFDPVDVELAARSFVTKMLMSFKYQPKSMIKRESVPEMILIKPTQRNELNEVYGDDYDLNSVFEGRLLVFPVEIDQRSFLESTGAVKVASIYNNYLKQYF